MALTIDELNIQIASDSSKATRALTSLIKKLEKLKTTLDNSSLSNITITNSFNQVTQATNRTTQATKKHTEATKKSGDTSKKFTDKLAQQISKTRTLMGAFNSAANIMAGWFKESNDYIETLNLFNVSMGEGADEARRYAESVQDLIGIDIKEWMQYQGTFKQLTSGFGVAEESANKMSKNLTQLSYDLASFFNTDVEAAFDKLSSAMAGQVKGLREFGIDTTVASLQEYALARGIETSVRAMTQAEKSLLRYNYIMEKSIIIQGDMARTIVTPANSLRILNAQLTQMKRALGNIVSVIVVKFIPYVQAMVQIITDAANALAKFFGFEIPEINYDGIGGGFADDLEDAEDAAGGVSDTLKEIKKQLMGFDELNIITMPNTDSGSGSDAGAAGGAGLGMDVLEYDFLKNLNTSKLDEIKEKMQDILNIVGLITLGIAAWKLYDFIKDLDTVQKKAFGLTLMITGYALEFDGAKEIGNGTATMWDWMKTIIGGALGIAGSLLVFGTGPLGWTIGIGIALTTFIVGFTVGYNEKQLREDLESRFGEIALTVEEVNEWAESLTTTDLSVKIGLYVEEEELLKELKEQVNSAITKLEKLNFKAEFGLDISEDSYKEAVDEFIKSSQEYMLQKQMVATLAVDIIYDNSSTGKRLSEFTTNFYSAVQGKLSTLGNELKDVVSTGFVDGVWIDDKLAEAVKLEKEIQEILDYVSKVEFEAKLETLKLDASSAGTSMTAESFTNIMAQAQDTVNENIKNLEGIRLEAVKIAKLEYDQNVLNGMSETAAKQIYDSAVSQAQTAFLNGKLELTYGTYSFGMETLTAAFEEEIKLTIPILQKDTQTLFMEGTTAVLPGETYENLDLLFYQLTDAYEKGFSDVRANMTPSAVKNLETLLSSLEPSAEQLAKIADEARNAGEKVPEGVSEGLHNYNLLKAITGDLEGINYLVGEKLSTDPTFLETLDKSENAGWYVTDALSRGLYNGQNTVEGEASDTVKLIGNTIQSQTKTESSLAEKVAERMGVDVSKGVYNGAEGEMTTQKPWWQQLWEAPLKWFKEKNEIESPSKAFERAGNDTVQGLWNGLKSTWAKLSAWWNGLGLSQISFKMPHFSWTSTPAGGWMSDVLDALGLPTSLPKLNISWYASGGFPTMGEMFIAREAGPELVGQIGKKTAIANNDQIISGIEAGVYRAMRAANSGGNGTVTVNATFEMDGEVIGQKVIKYHNGVVMQTGESPLLT